MGVPTGVPTGVTGVTGVSWTTIVLRVVLAWIVIKVEVPVMGFPYPSVLSESEVKQSQEPHDCQLNISAGVKQMLSFTPWAEQTLLDSLAPIHPSSEAPLTSPSMACH